MTFLSRPVWLLAVASLIAGGAVGVACSSDNTGDDTSGTDSGKDSTTDGKVGGDGGLDATGGDSGPPVTCEAGVSGECDIVAQNCGPGKDCDAVLTDGGYVAKCVSNTTGAIKEGFDCTPSNTSNPCAPGLECIQLVQGQPGRCSKHCCLNDDSACGTSQPEQFPGKCNLNITDPSSKAVLYTVCEYNKPCQPFQIESCGAGFTCLVQNGNGTATCSGYANGNGGLPEKSVCAASNACSDGLGCYGSDGGFTCQWNCYVKGVGGPYDSQIAADAGAGKGGCPSSEKCVQIAWANNALPTWFGLCQ